MNAIFKLHPAVAQTLRDRIMSGSIAADMKPEDWTGLRDGFLKWTAEEEAEPEHADGKKITATDSSLTIAFDRDSVREKDHDGRMKVKTANISKATVNPYMGKEIPGWEELGLDPKKIYQLLRDPAELEKAAHTFNGVQLLKKHTPVNADDHKPYDVVGTTGTEAKFEHPFLTNSLHVWSQDAIDDIESDDKKELSCGYHYRPEMTPGKFDGMPYDGVMRDIVGNHVALVKDGRAGPDVVVGDSTENLMTKPTRLAALTLSMTAAALAPMIAMDSKVTIPKGLFAGFTTKNFKDSKAKLLAGTRVALDGKLRKGLALDASMEGLAKAIDTFADMPETMDEPAPEMKAKEMEADAAIEPMKEAAAEKKEEEAFDAEPIKSFLKEKGCTEDEIDAVMDMLPKSAMDADGEEEKAQREKDQKALDETKKALEAKDNEMKDMVKKPAMDAAIKIAVDSAKKEVLETQRNIQTAIREVHPWTGDLAADLVFDSADAVRGKALEILGIDVKGVPPAAFGAMLKLAPKPGAQPVRRSEQALGMDEAGTTKFNAKYPGAANIQAA